MQGAFDFYQDLPRRPARPERLFFALFSDAGTAARIRAFGNRFLDENDLAGARLRPDRLHVSLHHIDDYKRLRTKYVFAARLAADAVSMRPFEVTFRSVASFDRVPRRDGRPPCWPLVLLADCEALADLHGALGAALRANGLKAADPFTPHMTLSYCPRAVAKRAIEPIRFTVDEFVLVHSELWLTRYHMLHRRPLLGEPLLVAKGSC